MAARKKPTPRGSQSGQKPGKANPLTITSSRTTGSSGPDLSAIARGMASGQRSSAGKSGGSAKQAKTTPPGQSARKKRKRPPGKPGNTIVVA